MLWAHLSRRQLSNVRFNRQVPIGPYICDFAARSAGLIVELDGGQHVQTQEYDRNRTTYLKQQGYRVLRFWNNDVLGNLDGVLRVIEEALTHRPSPDPSRRAGGEG